MQLEIKTEGVDFVVSRAPQPKYASYGVGEGRRWVGRCLMNGVVNLFGPTTSCLVNSGGSGGIRTPGWFPTSRFQGPGRTDQR
jgi:hypothetical protein